MITAEGEVGIRMYMQTGDKITLVYTIKTVAHLTKNSERRIRAMCDEGTLIATKHAGLWWIPKKELDYLAANGLPSQRKSL